MAQQQYTMPPNPREVPVLAYNARADQWQLDSPEGERIATYQGGISAPTQRARAALRYRKYGWLATKPRYDAEYIMQAADGTLAGSPRGSRTGSRGGE